MHPNPKRRFEPIYSMAVGAGRVFFGGVLQLRPKMTGAESIPKSGPAVLAITHFGYMDFALVEWVAWLRTRRRVRYMVTKRAADKPVVGWLLGQMRHIPVDMSAGRDAYTNAVAALKRGEVLGVFPEAGVSASFTVRELKTGAVRMAAAAGVPVIPVVVWGGQLLRTKNHRASFREALRAPIRVSIGKPMHVSGSDDPVEATAALRTELETLLADAQATYPRSGEGQWWQPAHLGGSAPTPEVAAEMEAERQRKRAAEKH
ncbi:lysophospholipid acyltransferase family protein [Microbacterium aurantiacum]|uniref:1-acyl-sn-glycerol-3-phosphate acyltransferase n=1 Tax=Microbacterium aurantiacum TaxID=162393 RepID=A0AAJ2HHT5_9MICO|nr:lysophospholipid acyltransferase family protein [Microbacterium aurantiacum]MDS0246466.1 1-acyl-sn-glycerol-3-phosphate acyltransferase [Microbacterium aurantiacum]